MSWTMFNESFNSFPYSLRYVSQFSDSCTYDWASHYVFAMACPGNGCHRSKTIDYFTKWLEAAYYIRQLEERDQEYDYEDFNRGKTAFSWQSYLRRSWDSSSRRQSRCNLDTISSSCLMSAICHGQCYQRRMARAWNKKVRPRHLKEGDFEPTIR